MTMYLRSSNLTHCRQSVKLSVQQRGDESYKQLPAVAMNFTSGMHHAHHTPQFARLVFNVGKLVGQRVTRGLPAGWGLEKVTRVNQDPLEMGPTCKGMVCYIWVHMFCKLIFIDM